MKQCNKCGCICDDTQNFCNQCGNNLNATLQQQSVGDDQQTNPMINQQPMPQHQNQPQFVPAPQPPKKKKKKLGCLIPLILVIICIAAVGAGISMSMENEMPFTELVEQPLADAMEKVDELGYTAKYIYDQGFDKSDFTEEVTDFIAKDEKLLAKYIITRYDNVNPSDKTVDLYINTIDHVNAKEAASELEKTLGHINACQAIERYGSAAYPYGFKLHYATDLQGYEMTGNNDTWSIRCSATITNAYGAEKKVICEAKVTGTNSNPSVTEFNVY